MTVSSLLLLMFSTAFSQVPTIASFAPTSGAVGTSVTITGTNFNSTLTNNIVYFGAVEAAVTGATSTSLTVTVPTSATYAPITITEATTGLTAYSDIPFAVTFPKLKMIDATSFGSKIDYSTGTFTWSVAVMDMNADGKPDLVVADNPDTVVTNNGHSQVSVLSNGSSSGSFAFSLSGDFLTATYPFCIAGDVNGDGKPDLVVTNWNDNTISVFRNTTSSGSIDFADSVNFHTGTNASGAAIADIDGDGKPDIVVTNAGSQTLSVLRNTGSSGSISFAPKADFATGSWPEFVAAGDLDGDGKPDLVVTNFNDNNISVYRNTSSAGYIDFADSVDFGTGTSPWSVVIGDIDGDGKPDLVVSNYKSNTVSIFRNTSSSGSISFAPRVDLTTGWGPIGVAISTLDGDEKPDIVVANAGGTDYPTSDSNSVSIFGNTSSPGSISFGPKVDFATEANPHYVAVSDLNADGKPDIVVTNFGSGNVSVLPSVIGEVALSVQATGFKAIAANGTITLTWQTQSEINNLGFNIFRKDAGTEASSLIASYISDASLHGLGTSTTGKGYSYKDIHAVNGHTYEYTVESVSSSDAKKDYPPIQVAVNTPKNYALYQNYPDPFNPTTTIRFDLREPSAVVLDVFNTLGQKIMEKNYGSMNAGTFEKELSMAQFASGVYYYRIEAIGNDGEHFVSIKKLALLK